MSLFEKYQVYMLGFLSSITVINVNYEFSMNKNCYFHKQFII